MVNSNLIRILGIDPGVTTGWAIVDFNPELTTFKLIEYGELTSINELHHVLTKSFKFCAVENFHLIAKIAHQVAVHDPKLLTVQIIGAIKFAVDPNKRFMQRPNRKDSCPAERLRSLGLVPKEGLRVNGNDHVADAIRHCVIRADAYLRQLARAQTGPNWRI